MKKLAILALPLFVAACGGGGDSSSSSPAPTLNLNAAYVAYIKNGSSTTSTISGYCAGTARVTDSAAYSGKNYDGVAALIVNNSEVDTVAANSPALCSNIFSSNEGGQVYKKFYDPTTLLPMNEGGSQKWEIYSGQQALPSSVTAGTQGTFYNLTDYKGGSSPVTSGVVTYAVTSDTATTLFVTMTETMKLVANGAPYYTANTVFRLNANNTLSQVSTKIQAYPAATGTTEISVTTTVVN